MDSFDIWSTQEDPEWVDQMLLSVRLSSQNTSPSPIQHRITPVEEGVMLSIWESAPVTSDRIHPYLYVANYRVSTTDEAQQILNEYLAIAQTR
jgi:hypothetical protein